jgi:high-affinity iron transporter
MLAAAIIVFREVLESALIVSIVLSAARCLPRRLQWVGGGVLGGLLGAVAVAGFAGEISSAVSGMGLEVFNASVLGLAVIMLGWHNVWMAHHGREMARHAGDIGRMVHDGKRPAYALAIVCGVAVLREGSETVLFMYGILASGRESMWLVASGGLMGAFAGISLGLVLYFGLMRLPIARLFKVSGVMILMLAAGLAAQCAGYLVQADILPAFGTRIWDSSHILSESSVLGKVLHTLVGYIAQPQGIQIVFYVVTIAVIAAGMRLLAPQRAAVKSVA